MDYHEIHDMNETLMIISCYCPWIKPKEHYFRWNRSVTVSAVSAELIEIAGQPIFQSVI